MVNIVKLDGTALSVADLVENNTHVKLTLTDEEKKEFTGEKADLTVNWTPDV